MIEELRKKFGENVLANEPLSRHCTFRIGGPAKYFLIAESGEEVTNAVKVAKELGLKFFIFSGGSNILFSDQGFDGLVIKIQNTKYEILDAKIVAEAGVPLARVVEAATENCLTGLEWAAGIPGTVGGAVRGNAGAYGHAIGEMVENVEALEVKSEKLKVKNYRKEDCKFGYRESVFKHNNDIILKVALKLQQGDKGKIKAEVEKNLAARDEKLPLEYPSAGCVLKNVEITDEILKSFRFHSTEEIPEEFIKRKKIPAAWLIERCDLKGKKVGGAKISEKHANFIVNVGKATADNVVALVSLIKMKVRDEFGIQLQEEIEYVGF